LGGIKSVSIYIMIEADRGDAGLRWDFPDHEYEKALTMFNSLVYADRDKGILLRDGERNDEVWLKKVFGKKTAWQKITAAVMPRSHRLFSDDSGSGHKWSTCCKRWPGRGTKPPAS